MSFNALNIHVYKEKNNIELELTDILQHDPLHRFPTILESMIKAFGGKEEDINKEFNRREIFVAGNSLFDVLYMEYPDRNPLPVVYGTTCYKLPSDPTIMMHFLAVAESRLVDFNYGYIVFNDFSFDSKFLTQVPDAQRELRSLVDAMPEEGNIENPMVEESETERPSFSKVSIEKIDGVVLEQLLANNRVEPESVIKQAINTILSLAKDMINYVAAVNKLNEVSRWHEQYPAIPFRFLLLSQSLADVTAIASLLNPDTKQASKVEALCSLAHRYIKADQQKSFNYLLDSLDDYFKRKLFAPCISKQAPDGDAYNFSCITFRLLKNAVFILRDDGRLSFSLKDNAVYKNYYAKNSDWGGFFNHIKEGFFGNDQFYAEFQKHLKYFSAYTGIQFDNLMSADEDQELIFTPGSSQHLIKLGLHCFNKPYVQTLLRTHNQSEFYLKRETKDPTNPPPNFSKLPLDLFVNIMNKTRSSDRKEVRLDGQDQKAVGHILFSRK